MDKAKFIEGINDWNNHVLLLWLALEQTKTGTVLEFGCGDGSTRQLHEYCKDTNRILHSFETDLDWMEKYDCKVDTHLFHHVVNNWQITKDICPNPSVILVDNAPGHSRADLIKWYSDF